MSYFPPPIGTTAGTYMGATDTRVVALAASLDDPGNASGGGAGAIVGGVVYAHLWAGVTRGSGQTTAVRTATFNGLQAAMNYAASSGKVFRITAGVYEIYGSGGLIAPLTAGFMWMGDTYTHIIQFYVNTPVLTIGDTTGNSYGNQQRYEGALLDHGVSQTGNTLANGLNIGACTQINIANFAVCSYYGTNPPWIGINISCGTGSNNFFFQNIMRDIQVGGAQQSFSVLAIGGTGSRFENWYQHNGGSPSTALAMSGPAMVLIPANYGTTTDDEFSRINIEHVKTSIGLNTQGVSNAIFTTLHFEDVQLNASGSKMIDAVGSEIKFMVTLVLDMQVISGATGCSFFKAEGYQENCEFEKLRIRFSSYNTSGLVSTFTLFPSPNNDTSPNTKVTGLSIGDDANVNAGYITLDGICTAPLPGGAKIGEYVGDNLLPSTKRYSCALTAAYTHYGQHADAVLIAPAAITAPFNAGLSNKFKASGPGSSRLTPPGTIMRFRRASGTVSGVITFVDVATGNTITTNSTSGVDLIFQMGATSWALIA